MNEDYPYEETMRRWKHWFMANRLRVGGYCRNVVGQMPAVDREPLLSAVSTMDAIRKRVDRWLAAVLQAHAKAMTRIEILYMTNVIMPRYLLKKDFASVIPQELSHYLEEGNHNKVM